MLCFLGCICFFCLFICVGDNSKSHEHTFMIFFMLLGLDHRNERLHFVKGLEHTSDIKNLAFSEMFPGQSLRYASALTLCLV